MKFFTQLWAVLISIFVLSPFCCCAVDSAQAQQPVSCCSQQAPAPESPDNHQSCPHRECSAPALTAEKKSPQPSFFATDPGNAVHAVVADAFSPDDARSSAAEIPHQLLIAYNDPLWLTHCSLLL